MFKKAKASIERLKIGTAQFVIEVLVILSLFGFRHSSFVISLFTFEECRRTKKALFPEPCACLL